MASPLTLNGLGPIQTPWQNPVPAPTVAPTFQDALVKGLSDLKTMNEQTTQSIGQSLTSGDLAMVETFTTVREADLAFRLTMQIRNKLVDAWQQLQNMSY